MFDTTLFVTKTLVSYSEILKLPKSVSRISLQLEVGLKLAEFYKPIKVILKELPATIEFTFLKMT